MSDEAARDDDLRAAFDALRDETRDEGAPPAATLRRVLGSARVRTRRRLLLWKVGLPIAAVLAVSSAWAAASGRFTDTVSASVQTNCERVLEALAQAPIAAPPPRGSGFVAPTIADAADSADPVPVAPALTTTAVARVDAAHSSNERVSTPSAPPSSASISGPAPARSSVAAAAPAPDRDLLAEDKSAFEAAYRASASGTPAVAVAAWDRYLAAHPDGRFVPEARYARAVALARAGDKGAAREALREFASGEPGSYRHEDAVQLIDKLK
jgi:TolA-binding protein